MPRAVGRRYLGDISESKTLRILQRQALDYRNKAEELRTHSEALGTPQARQILSDLASDADRLAEKLEVRIQALAAQLDR